MTQVAYQWNGLISRGDQEVVQGASPVKQVQKGVLSPT